MFYAFNTVNEQAVLLDALSSDSLRMLDLLKMMMSVFSGVVACVLGFLVVYANRFIIRRRRHEFCMYLILGMSPRRVSGILLCETAIVGAASLVASLALGIGLSQGLSFATAALMGTTMSKYQFIVSSGAIGFTCLCFLAIFAVSALVDIAYIRRCKLAKLLSAHEASESVKPVRIPLRVVGFVVGVAALGCAYWQLTLNGMVMMDEHFALATALMVVGTFLFFWSVAGFTIAVLTRSKGVYLKGVRMFTVRQISSKVNTAFASMATVIIMLFFALTSTSVGMGLVELLVGNLENTTAYDATIVARTASAFEGPDESAQLFEQYDGDMAAWRHGGMFCRPLHNLGKRCQKLRSVRLLPHRREIRKRYHTGSERRAARARRHAAIHQRHRNQGDFRKPVQRGMRGDRAGKHPLRRTGR